MSDSGSHSCTAVRRGKTTSTVGTVHPVPHGVRRWHSRHSQYNLQVASGLYSVSRSGSPSCNPRWTAGGGAQRCAEVVWRGQGGQGRTGHTKLGEPLVTFNDVS